MIKAVLFDIDGTLLDTTEFIYQGFEHVFKLHDKKHLNRSHVKPLVGRSLQECYQNLIPEVEYDILRMNHTEFQMRHIHLAQPYPRITETLSILKNKKIRLAAITSRIRASVHQTLELASLLHFFEITICVEDVQNLKPHPEPFEKALNALNLKASEVIMVGDTKADIEGGCNAGIKTVGVTYGFHTFEEMKACRPDYLIDSIDEILTILDSLNN